jgi:hypothetical protein
MSFGKGLGKIALGVGCVMAAPFVVSAVLGAGAVAGAVGVISGATTLGAAATAGGTAATLAGASVSAVGVGVAKKGVDETIDEV